MALAERIKLYKDLEKIRGRPLIMYITSHRGNAGGQISSDVVGEFLDQFQELDDDAKDLDLLLVSHGGDPTVAWRIVSLIREQVSSFSVLVPQAAYSAATLIALGADEIVMHPHGNLGPTDPQILSTKDGTNQIQFGSEDLSAFLKFAREEVGLSDQAHMVDVFNKFCDQVSPVTLGVAARSSHLSISMGEKLLRLHMVSDSEQQKARVIAEKLTKDFFHHGYPVNRTEAKQIGLKIAKSDSDVEAIMWEIWRDIEQELQLREPFLEMKVLRNDPTAAPLFSPMPHVHIPPNLPDDLRTQIYAQVLAQLPVSHVPPSKYTTVHAVVESARHASRFLQEGLIFGGRGPDSQFKIAKSHVSQGWETVFPRLEPAPEKATTGRKSPKSKGSSSQNRKKTSKKRKKTSKQARR